MQGSKLIWTILNEIVCQEHILALLISQIQSDLSDYRFPHSALYYSSPKIIICIVLNCFPHFYSASSFIKQFVII